MDLKTRLMRFLMNRLSQDDLLRVTGEMLDERLRKLSQEERTAFLQQMVEANMERALAGLERSQRAQLMNDLLPLIARHFPLEDVDILGAFADFEDLQALGKEES